LVRVGLVGDREREENPSVIEEGVTVGRCRFLLGVFVAVVIDQVIGKRRKELFVENVGSNSHHALFVPVAGVSVT